MWVRPLDVPALLTARRYTASGRVVIDVVDDQGLAGGRFVLEASPEGATCRASDEPADLTMPVRTLGAVSLGGMRLRALHAAGWCDELTAGAVTRADARVHRPDRPVVQHLVLRWCGAQSSSAPSSSWSAELDTTANCRSSWTSTWLPSSSVTSTS